jgi:hypothetical protein
VAKPSKKVMEVVVLLFFAKIKPKKKVTTQYCRYLLHFKKEKEKTMTIELPSPSSL